MRGKKPYGYYQRRRYEHKSVMREIIPQNRTGQCSCKGRDGVDMLNEYVRGVAGEHIAQYATAHSGYNSDKRH